MVSLPMTGHMPVIRTDFSDPAAWEAARAAILAPGAEAAMFAPDVELGRMFRTVADELHGIEANLTIAEHAGDRAPERTQRQGRQRAGR